MAATPGDIAEVRRATDEPTQQEYSDDLIGIYVDAYGVSGANAKIWREKAASYAADVDTTEAGASHKFSDLHKNALAMAKHWEAVAASETEEEVPTSGRLKIKKIERS